MHVQTSMQVQKSGQQAGRRLQRLLNILTDGAGSPLCALTPQFSGRHSKM